MDSSHIRNEFPILKRLVNDRSLVYLDNAATSQKPKIVLEAIQKYYTHFNANVHRGIHTLSQEATTQMEHARTLVQKFIHAQHSEEIIFTSGTTESINLLAYSLSSRIQKGDEIIISALEHHSNIVPWQMLCERTGALLRVIPMNEEGVLQLEDFKMLLNENTKLVSVCHVSNALGVINPIEQIIDMAHQNGTWVMVDGAQSAPHFAIDMQKLDADFYAFSAHKMYGPTGVGILYGKKDLLNELPPFMGGGEMIAEVSFDKTTYADLPFKFEAGTPNIAGNIAFGKAIEFLQDLGMDAIQKHDAQLMQYCQNQLQQIPEVIIYAAETPKSGAISFNINLPEVHPSDVGFILDKQGIAVRTGHHCTQPIMNFLDIKGTVRVSFACYNTKEDIDDFISALKKSIGILA